MKVKGESKDVDLKLSVHQDSMVLAQRQKYRSMEQNRKPRDKSMYLIFNKGGKNIQWRAKMVEEWDGETTFSPTNSLKEHLNTEKTSQNNF